MIKTNMLDHFKGLLSIEKIQNPMNVSLWNTGIGGIYSDLVMSISILHRDLLWSATFNPHDWQILGL